MQAIAFGVINEVHKTDLNLLEDYDGHPSLRTHVAADGYQIVTFISEQMMWQYSLGLGRLGLIGNTEP